MAAEAREEGSFKAFILSELNGATKYMYDEGLIGLAHHIASLPDREKPNMLIVNGGLLPELPTNRGGPRMQNNLTVLLDGVKNLSGAAAVMKPHMERLQAALSQDATFIYAMGRADAKNIDDIKLRYAKLYSKAIQKIRTDISENLILPELQEATESIESSRTLIEGMEAEERRLLQRISGNTNLPQRRKLLAILQEMQLNLRVNRQELEEAEERVHLLERLHDLIYNELPLDRIKTMLEEAREESKRTNLMLQETEHDSQEYEILSREAKNYGNRIRALQKRLKESIDKGTTKDMIADLGAIQRHNANIPLPKDIHDIINCLAKSHYRTHLRDALGRKRDVVIQDVSLEVYQRLAGRFAFNVIVTDGLDPAQAIKKGSNSVIGTRVYDFVTKDKDVEHRISMAPLNIVISSRHAYTSFAMDPFKNQSGSLMALLCKGPFVDIGEVARFYNHGIMTDITKIVDRMPLDSSVSVVKVSEDGNIIHTTLKPGFLRDERIKSDIAQNKALQGALDKIRDGKLQPTGGEDPALMREILTSKRPSEMKDRELCFADEALIKSRVPYVGLQKPGKPDEFTIAHITDVHIGNYGDLALLKAFVNDALSRQPFLLSLGGDNIEGNHHNYKYTQRPENDLDIMGEFERFLMEKGFTQSEIDKAKLDRYEKQRVNVISNIDAQSKVFVDAIQDLAIDVVKRGGYIVITSGNHYNKTHGDSQHDEATILKAHIEMLLCGVASSGNLPAGWRSHIKTGSGSDIAAETYRINGMDIEIRHGLATKEGMVVAALEAQRSSAKLVVTGHGHEIREVITDSAQVVQGPTMQASETNPYGKVIHVPINPTDSLNGGLILTYITKGDEILGHSFEPRRKDQLGVDDKHFYGLLRDRRDMRRRTLRVVA